MVVLILLFCGSLFSNTWTSPTTLDTIVTPTQALMDVSSNATGGTFAVWPEQVEGVTTIYASNFVDGSWSTPAAISDPISGTIQTVFSSINASGDKLVIWQIQNGDREVYASLFRDGSWQGSQKLSANGVDSYELRGQVDDSGTAIVVWEISFGEVYTRINKGGAWSTAEAITPEGNNINYPRLSMDGSGNAVMVVYDSTDGTMIANTYNGTSWDGVVTITGATSSSNIAEVSMNSNGQAMAVWVYQGGSDGIEWSYYNGSTWTDAAAISGYTGQFGNPKVSFTDEGYAFVTVENGTGNEYVYRYNGSSWSQSVDLGSAALNPLVTYLSTGGALVTYTTSSTVYARLFDGSSWGSATAISSTDTAYILGSQVQALNAYGTGAAIWEDTATNNIRVATFTPTAYSGSFPTDMSYTEVKGEAVFQFSSSSANQYAIYENDGSTYVGIGNAGSLLTLPSHAVKGEGLVVKMRGGPFNALSSASMPIE